MPWRRGMTSLWMKALLIVRKLCTGLTFEGYYIPMLSLA